VKVPVLELVTTILLIATLLAKLNEVAPVIDCALVSNVAPPAVNDVPPFVIPPLKTKFPVVANVLATLVVLKVEVPERLTLPTNISALVLSLSVKPPAPVIVVVPATVNAPVLLLVSKMPVMAILLAKLNDVAPVIGCAFVSNVAPPAEKEVPPFVIPPLKTKFAVVVTAVEVNVDVLARLTLPTKISVPLLLESVKPPAPVIVVVPLTVKVAVFALVSTIPVMATLFAKLNDVLAVIDCELVLNVAPPAKKGPKHAIPP